MLLTLKGLSQIQEPSVNEAGENVLLTPQQVIMTPQLIMKAVYIGATWCETIFITMK